MSLIRFNFQRKMIPNKSIQRVGREVKTLGKQAKTGLEIMETRRKIGIIRQKQRQTFDRQERTIGSYSPLTSKTGIYAQHEREQNKPYFKILDREESALIAKKKALQQKLASRRPEGAKTVKYYQLKPVKKEKDLTNLI